MSQPKILIAEDSQVQVNMLQRHLSQNYELVITRNGLEAIEQLKSSQEFMALILDIVMPEADGYSVLNYINSHSLPVKTVVVSAQPRQVLEARALSLGMDYFIPKPLEPDALLELLKKWGRETDEMISGAFQAPPVTAPAPTMINGKKYPFETVLKCCYICGYHQVKFHRPVPGTYSESWESGLYPEYQSFEGFEPWDFLRTYVAVCPYCFFASSKIEDFAETDREAFPYSEDAKKILSRTISSRRKLLSEVKEVDKRFDNPNRDLEKVMDSLKLAEKCMNGLILGGKSGAYAQIGMYQLLLGGLHQRTKVYYYERALESFRNQMKQSEVKEEDTLTSSYLIMSLEMALHSSQSAKKQWEWIEDRYVEGIDALTESEKAWFDRILYLWDHGVRKDETRLID